MNYVETMFNLAMLLS